MIVFLWGGGSWISALASIFYEIWLKDIIIVDKYKSEITDIMTNKWIKTIIWDWVYDYSENDVIIYSDAVINSKDFKKVKNNYKFSYFQFLWEISKRFKTISIAWTHWKTSTTSMTLSCLKNFDKLWLWIVWGFVSDLDWKNYIINSKHKEDIKIIIEKILNPKWKRPSELFKKYYFVVEADEFNKHFLLLDSDISIITKVDHDHKDIYPTKKEYLNAFNIFIDKTKKISLSLDPFSQKIEKVKLKKFNFNYIFWEHMQENASLVFEITKRITNLNENNIKNCIENFKWVWRRQEYLWKLKNDLIIYTDYAHHFVEIEATYEAFKNKFWNKKIYVVFQPHQLFRFIWYQEEFEKVLSKIDNLIIYNIYSIREEKLLKKIRENLWNKRTESINTQYIIKTIWKNIAKKVWWTYIANFENLIDFLKNKKWIALIMSAWNLDYEMRNFINKN